MTPNGVRSAEQDGEQLGREQPDPLSAQEPVDRPLGLRRLAPAGTSGRQVRAAQLAPEGHSLRHADRRPTVHSGAIAAHAVKHCDRGGRGGDEDVATVLPAKKHMAGVESHATASVRRPAAQREGRLRG